MSTIDVVNNRLVFPLLGISKLHHAYSSSGAIETIEEVTFHSQLLMHSCVRFVYQ